MNGLGLEVRHSQWQITIIISGLSQGKIAGWTVIQYEEKILSIQNYIYWTNLFCFTKTRTTSI